MLNRQAVKRPAPAWLGLLVLIGVLLSESSAQAQVNVVILHPQPPPAYQNSQAYGIWSGFQGGWKAVGEVDFNAVLWAESASNWRILEGGTAANPAVAYAAWEDLQVGTRLDSRWRARLWSPAGIAPLPSDDFLDTFAYGVSIGMERNIVGTGISPACFATHALLWRCDISELVDLHLFLPPVFSGSEARGVFQDNKVGWAKTEGVDHAIAWLGPENRVVPLHPPPDIYLASRAYHIHWMWIVGETTLVNNQVHAFLWTLSDPLQYADLHPEIGFTESRAYGVYLDFFGSAVVGSGKGPATGDKEHALLFYRNGHVLDLHRYLPACYESSAAYGVYVVRHDVGFNIVGVAWTRVGPSTQAHAVMWVLYGTQGDVNGDRCANDQDLLMMLSQFGESGCGWAGDANGNGIVDDSDLSIALSNFGQGC